MEYPYQIVTFLDTEPAEGQLIYGDENGGWLAQVALKRRFALKDLSEVEFTDKLRDFCASVSEFKIETETLQKPEHMPVEVIPVHEPSAATQFHQDFLKQFEASIISKYPEREGKSYFAHITAQYWGKRVIDASQYDHKTFHITSVWVVKDEPGEQNTRTLERFSLQG